MNYFLTFTGLEPTGMTPEELMRYIKNTDEQNISPTFRRNFIDTVEHPNVLFVKKDTRFDDLTNHYAWRMHDYPKGMNSEERLAHAAEQNIVYVIAEIGYFKFSPKVVTMELYTLDSTRINTEMRRASIDNIMGTI